MPGQHGNAVKQSRSSQAIAVAEQMTRRYQEGLIGTVQSVLFEEMAGDCATGHAPNAVRVYVRGGDLHNQIRSVRVTGLYQDGVLGVLTEAQPENP